MLDTNESFSADFLAGGGEMGALMRAHDWAVTPLGPPQAWPQGLRTALRILLNTSHPMLIWWGSELIQFYNDAYRQVMGPLRHPHALGQRGRECWAEIWDAIGPRIEQVMSGGGATWHENQLVPVLRDGRLEQACWSYSYSPIDEDGGTGGVLVICHDMTAGHLASVARREREAELARAQAEQALRQGEEELRTLAEAIPHHIWTARPDGWLDWFNPRVYEYAGCSRGELDGDRWGKIVHPDDVAGALAAWTRAVGCGEPYEVEFRLRRADGAFRWFLARAVAARDQQGRIMRWIGTNTDVHDHKLIADQLAELNATLAQRVEEKTRERDRIWNVSQDLLLVAERNGVWRTLNPAWTRTLGWSEAELLNRTSEWLEHPDDNGIAQAQFKRLGASEATVRFESRFRHKDGSYRWLSWTGVADQDHVYAVARDVTAEKAAALRLKATEEALLQSRKMEAVGQLTGGIAHDFNNLLTGIVGSLDLLQHRLTQGRTDNFARYINAAMTSANRAAALTHRLLAFARRQPLIPTSVDVNQLVGSLEDLLRRTIGETIDLEIIASNDLWFTLCDPNQLESALLNLAINARDAMPDGGKLTISTSNAWFDSVTADTPALLPGDYVCIVVTDSGVGMSAEVAARAFDPFFTTKPIGHGTGLGLSMIYGFARQSNGHVTIESKVGRGTSVWLYLPRHHGDVAAGHAAAARAAEHAATGETVLVVEDEPVVRAVIVEMLGEQGYRTLDAIDGPSGLEILRSRERIDLLVTDVGLPGINGRQLADQARETRPDLKILFVTGYAESVAISKDFLQPGTEMMTKPFDLDVLSRRVRAMISG
jgi:PAS domain S-box-containing protein